MKQWFRSFSYLVSNAAGAPAAFLISLLLVLAWAATGPLFNFSDTWQLVINTATTVVTFLMVFVIQSTQNRDTHALQLKLDELIRSTRDARNIFVGLEGLPDEAIQELQAEFDALHRRATALRHKRSERTPET